VTTLDAALTVVEAALSGLSTVRQVSDITSVGSGPAVVVGMPSALTPVAPGAWDCTVPVHVVGGSTLDAAGLVDQATAVMAAVSAARLNCTADVVDIATDAGIHPAYLITVEV